MEKEDFARAVVAMEGTLYRVAYGLLHTQADREDAVQEASAMRGKGAIRCASRSICVPGWCVS